VDRGTAAGWLETALLLPLLHQQQCDVNAGHKPVML